MTELQTYLVDVPSQNFSFGGANNMDKYPIKGQTISSLELKCELVVDGIRLHPSAQEGVGTQYKEQVHSLFDFDEDFHSDVLRLLGPPPL